MQMAIWCAYIVVNPLQAQTETKLSRVGDVPLSLSAALVTLVAKFVIERRLEAESRDLEAARSTAETPA